MNTPAMSEKATGTPRYPKKRKQNVMMPRMTAELMCAFPSASPA